MASTCQELRRRRIGGSFLKWSLAALMSAVLLVGSASAAPGQEAVVRPDPLISAVPVGGQVVIDIYIQDVQNLYGADIRLSYDPTVLEVQDANPAVSGVQIQPLSSFLKPDFVARNKACNVVRPGGPGLSDGRYHPVRGDAGKPFSAGERFGAGCRRDIQAVDAGRHAVMDCHA